MQLKRVVITGLGAITPLGKDLDAYWKSLTQGVSGAAPITKFNAENFKTRFACEVKDYDSSDYFDRKEARKLDPFSQFALISTREAIKNANIDNEKINPDRVGVIFGSGIGGIKTFETEVSAYAKGDGVPRFNPFFIPKMIADICSGHISIQNGFRGPNYLTMSACASSSNAIADAFNYIRLGKADMIISGGAEAAITEAGIGGFNALKALSTNNDSPETASRPFDKDRNGFVMGEGGGALVIEEYEHAKARGANILVEIAGEGMSADAYHMTAPHPEGKGAVSVMNNALHDAQLQANDIDYINVHGTSTPLGDLGEMKAIHEVFGQHVYDLNISSTKSMTGHLLGAAGVMESIACILSIRDQIVPPTINHFTDDEDFDLNVNYTFNQAQKREVKAVLNNTFGFGGHNCSLIFKKPQ